MNKFHLDIITPEKTFYSGEVESVVLDALSGKIGILAGREPIVIGLKAGEIKIKAEMWIKEAITSEGFAVVTPKGTTVTVSEVEWPEDFEKAQKRKEQEALDRQKREIGSFMEYQRSNTTMMRAFEKLQGKKTESSTQN